MASSVVGCAENLWPELQKATGIVKPMTSCLTIEEKVQKAFLLSTSLPVMTTIIL